MRILSLPGSIELSPEIVEKSRCEYLELRLDYCQNCTTSSIKTTLINISSSPQLKGVIFTYREIDEGGKSIIAATEKRDLMQQLSNYPKSIIDCELSFYINSCPIFNASNLIISKHFKTAPDKCQINQIMRQMKSIKARYYKVVVPINSYHDLCFYLKMSANNDSSLIIQGTGLLGKLFRMIRMIKNHQGHYLAINETSKTAEEQITIDEALLFDHINPNQPILYGGIIGSEQVYHSLGIKHYNKIFQKKNTNAVYLPLPAFDLSEFFEILELFQANELFYGCSVTSPHKQSVSNYFNIPNSPYNLITSIAYYQAASKKQLSSGAQKEFHNTDYNAFSKSFHLLNVKQHNKILVLGTGSTAVTALTALKDYQNVSLSGRNEIAAKRIAQRFGCQFVQIAVLNKTKCDLFINCTTIGMNKENLYKITGKLSFKKVIDLPYSKKPTPLIDYCRRENIAHVSGTKFWDLQATGQEKIFLDNILKHTEYSDTLNTEHRDKPEPGPAGTNFLCTNEHE